MTAHRLTRDALVIAFLAALGCSGRAPRGPYADEQEPPVVTVPSDDRGGDEDGDYGGGADQGGDGDDGGGGDGDGDRGDGGGTDQGGGEDDGEGPGNDDDGVLRVAIDVKPGSAGPAPIQRGANGKIPVAILGSGSFDVAAIEVGALRFAGAPIALGGRGGPMASLEDVNGDRYDDLVCHFDLPALAIEPDATFATLEGLMDDGAPFLGADAIRIVP
jgi:hypothetical protein